MVKDKLHFFGGFESTYRDLSGSSVITISPANAAAIGLPPQPTAIPREQTARFYIGKLDYQAGQAHRVTGRTIYFENDSPNNIAGGLNSTEVTTDFVDSMSSSAAQVVSTFGAQPSERAARAVREPPPEPDDQQPVRHRPTHQYFGGGELRRPERDRRRRRIRFQAEHLAGGGQLHAGCAGAHSYKIRRGCAVHRGHAHRVTVHGLHVPDDRRLPGGQERDEPAQLLDVHPAPRQPGLQHGRRRCTARSCRTTGA